MYKYKGKVLKVIDGDTFDILIDLGFNITIKERVRLFGINTPETRTRDKEEKAKGLLVKKFVKNMIEDKEVEVETHKRGKFGRYLVDIYYLLKDEWIHLNQSLIELKYAKEYYGGKR